MKLLLNIVILWLFIPFSILQNSKPINLNNRILRLKNKFTKVESQNVKSRNLLEIERLIPNGAVSLKSDMTSSSKSLDFRFKVKQQDDNDSDLVDFEILTSIPSSEESENENEIYPYSANANTEYTEGYWIFGKETFKATNSIYGNHGHWESNRNINNDFWEAVFKKTYKINLIEINFIWLPKFFQVFYQLDENSPFIAATSKHKIAEYIDFETAQKTNLDLVSKRYAVVFHRPIIAKRIKIVLTEFLQKDYFSIDKVRFFQKRSLVMIKNNLIDPCKELCFFVNTNIPRENVRIDAYDCLEILNLADNREIFVYNNDRSLMINNDKTNGKLHNCIGYNGSKYVLLQKCDIFQTSFQIDVKNDGTLYFYGSPESCIYIDGKKTFSDNFVNEETEVQASSQGDYQFYKKENVRIYGNDFWSSIPGDIHQNFQIIFGKFKQDKEMKYEIKKVDVIKIEWQYYPKRFRVYFWKPGSVWLLKIKYDNFKLKELDINVSGEQFSAVMIVMDDGYKQKELGDKIAYGIKNVYIGTKSYPIKVGDCEKIDYKYKSFDFDSQSFLKIDKTTDYVKTRYKVDVNYMLLKLKYKLIQKEKEAIEQSKNKAIDMHNLLVKTSKLLKEKIYIGMRKYRYSFLLKIQNVEFFKIVLKKKLKDKLYVPYDKIGYIGTKDSPATDCLALKRINKSIVSGFYYIKPECSKKSLRVFCDFSTLKGAMDVLIYNNEATEPNPDLSYLKIHTVKDIRYQCAKLGLFPIRIASKEVVERLSQILNFVGYDLNMPIAIPLGFDYECLNDNCQGFFRTFDMKDSPVINSFFRKAPPDLTNIKSRGKFAGLGFSGIPKLTTYNLETAKIGALICSTNHFENDFRDESVISITCNHLLSGNGSIFPLNNQIMVRCPVDCNLSKGKVYGNGLYHSSSNICLAAIHAGAITKSGGVFSLSVSTAQNQYASTSKNNIISFESNIDDGLPSFSVEKYVPECPIDIFKNNPSYWNKEIEEGKKSAFLETSFNLNKKSSFIANSEQDYYLNANINDNFLKNITNLALIDSKSIKNDTLSIPTKNQTQEIKISGNNTIDKLSNITQIKKKSIPELNNKQKFDSESRRCTPNTDKGIELLKSRKEELDWNYFEKIKEKSYKGSKKLQIIVKSMSWSSDDSKYSNVKLEVLLHFVENFKSKLIKHFLDLKAKAEARKERTNIMVNYFQDIYHNLIENDKYSLDYLVGKQLFTYEWRKFDFSNFKNVNTKWEIITNEIKTRSRAIGTYDKIVSYDFPLASFFILNHRKFYDFEMSVDILFKSKGRAGVAFRYVDPFNYYAIILNREKGIKEIIKIKYGVKKTLNTIRDDIPIIINKWIRIKIKSIGINFAISMYYPKGDYLTTTYEFADSDISSGSIALVINNIEGFFFDEFSIKGNPCWSPWIPSNTVDIIPNTSSIYSENFQGNFNLLYEIIDPLYFNNGPSQWEMIINPKNTDEEKSIEQKSEIYDSTSSNRPSMIILKNKYFGDGIYKVEFVPYSNFGVISIIFKYSKPNDIHAFQADSFYSFDLLNDSSGNQFILRREDNGISKEIKVIADLKNIPDCPSYFKLGYQINKPQYVQIMVSNGLITISISIDSKPYVVIMSVQDDTFKLGLVGIGTYQVKLSVINLELKPLKYIISSEKINNFILNDNDEILLNDNTEKNKDYEIVSDGKDEKSIEEELRSPVINNNTSKENDLWKQCVRKNTNTQREQYCRQHFKSSSQIKNCIVNFCDSCCYLNIFFKYTNLLHTCKKSCYKNTRGENNKANKNYYTDICIKSTNPKNNVYNFCQNRFQDNFLVKTCKYDMCNLCCVNISPIQNIISSVDILKDCFKSCSLSKII